MQVDVLKQRQVIGKTVIIGGDYGKTHQRVEQRVKVAFVVFDDSVGGHMHGNSQYKKENGNCNGMQPQRIAVVKAQQFGQIGHRCIGVDVFGKTQ